MRSHAPGSVVAVVLLPGGDPGREPVPLRGERAGRVRRESARGGVGLVEIEDHLTVDGHGGIEEAARRVGLRAAGGVLEDEEKLLAVFRHDRLEADLLPLALPDRIARAPLLLDVPEDVRDLEGLRWIVR